MGAEDSVIQYYWYTVAGTLSRANSQEQSFELTLDSDSHFSCDRIICQAAPLSARTLQFSIGDVEKLRFSAATLPAPILPPLTWRPGYKLTVVAFSKIPMPWYMFWRWFKHYKFTLIFQGHKLFSPTLERTEPKVTGEEQAKRTE